MRSGIAFAGVCFDLGYPDGDGSVAIGALKDAAKELRCNVEHIAGEERPVRRMEAGENTHGTILPPAAPAQGALIGPVRAHGDMAPRGIGRA